MLLNYNKHKVSTQVNQKKMIHDGSLINILHVTEHKKQQKTLNDEQNVEEKVYFNCYF